MDPIQNPFSPGAGSPPPELAGRDAILEKAKIALARIKQRRTERSFLFTGLRGVGKTVLLRQVEKLAKDAGYQVIFIEALDSRPLVTLLILHLRELLFALDLKERVVKEVKRGFMVLQSFIKSLKLEAKYGDAELRLSVNPETGTADSGKLEHDLPSLLEIMAEAAIARQTAIAIIIDEIQYLSEKELSALIMAIHRISQKSLPLILVGAGLPQLPRIAGDLKSYSERLFDFIKIDHLNEKDAITALQKPAIKEGAKFSTDAAREIVKKTKGYPYFIQEWGSQAWNISPSNLIDIQTARKATKSSIAKLDESFFRVRFDRLTPNEKKYLRALADIPIKDRRSGNVAEKLGKATQGASPARDSLIKKGMIYSQAHGETNFTVPMFDDFMKRTIPNSEK